MTLDDARLEESGVFVCPPCAAGRPPILLNFKDRREECARLTCRYLSMDEDGFYIEAIVGRKINAGESLYLVKWYG